MTDDSGRSDDTTSGDPDSGPTGAGAGDGDAWSVDDRPGSGYGDPGTPAGTDLPSYPGADAGPSSHHPPVYPPPSSDVPPQYPPVYPPPADQGQYPPGYPPQGGYPQHSPYDPSGYPAPPSYPYSFEQQPSYQNGQSIAALVLGICGFITCGVTGPLGIIFGAMGIKAANEGRANAKGMAIAGLVTGIITSLWMALWLVSFVVGAASESSQF